MSKMQLLKEYSNPVVVFKKAKEIYGPNVVIKPSDKKNKKYMILTPDKKVISFGQMGYQDYTKHKDEIRRQRYLDRATKIKGNWKNNKYSANSLSVNLLWDGKRTM